MWTTMTPLRRNALLFAIGAGFAGFDIKIKENRGAQVPAWDVFVRAPTAKRGRCIGAMLKCAALERGE